VYYFENQNYFIYSYSINRGIILFNNYNVAFRKFNGQAVKKNVNFISMKLPKKEKLIMIYIKNQA
jgi:hypothetical protein